MPHFDRHHPHHHHPHHHRHHHPHPRPPNHSTATLRALLRAGLIKDAASMAVAAEEIDPSGEAARYLRERAEINDPHHALRLLETHLERDAADRYGRCLGYATSGRVAIIPPVPPHLFQDFGGSQDAVALMVDDHELPPSIRHSGRLRICSGFAEALANVEQADVIIFDAYRDASGFFIRGGLITLLDDRHLQEGAHLLVHVRPHPDYGDQPAPPNMAARFEII
jgi:hypothetical protein